MVADVQAVFELVTSVRAQLCDGVGVEVDGATAGGGLEVAVDELVFLRQKLLVGGDLTVAVIGRGWSKIRMFDLFNDDGHVRRPR